MASRGNRPHVTVVSKDPKPEGNPVRYMVHTSGAWEEKTETADEPVTKTILTVQPPENRS